jgi:hypothetical protein
VIEVILRESAIVVGYSPIFEFITGSFKVDNPMELESPVITVPSTVGGLHLPSNQYRRLPQHQQYAYPGLSRRRNYQVLERDSVELQRAKCEGFLVKSRTIDQG